MDSPVAGLRRPAATEIVDAAFHLFRRAPVPYLLATAVVTTPWTILAMLIGPTDEAPIRAAIMVLASSLMALIAGAASTVITADLYQGRPPDAMAALALVARRFPAVAGMAIVKGLFNMVGLVLFLVGLLYTWPRTVPMTPALIIEGIGPGASFQRASELTRDNKRWILKPMLLMLFVYILVSFSAGAVQFVTENHVVLAVVQALVALVMTPFYAIVETLIYYDLRVRREGLDLEMMAAAPAAG